MEYYENIPNVLYFGSEGQITFAGKNGEIEPSPNWQTYEFDQRDIQDVINNPLGAYYVEQMGDVYVIRAKLNEAYQQDVDTATMHLINISERNTINISTKMLKKKIKITVNKVNNSAYLARTRRKSIPIYVTSKNDPHYLYHSTTVLVKDLLEKGVLELPLPEIEDEYSVYTMIGIVK